MDNQIMQILRDFQQITGGYITLFNARAEVIACYPEKVSSFCRAVQQSPEALDCCHNNDRIAMKIAKKTGRPYLYRCHCGLTEVVAPVFNYGELSGYFMLGQLAVGGQECLSEIKHLSEKYFQNSEECRRQCAKLSPVAPKLLQSYVNVLTILAEHLTQNNKVQVHRSELPAAVRQYLNQYYCSNIRLSDLCEIFHCSRATLTGRFKKAYGVTVMQYVHQCRVEKAQKELLQSEKSIKEIAVDCGFPDNNYFSKVFIASCGCPPTAYRKKCLSQQEEK